MERVRVGLVGCGTIANMMHLPGLKYLRGVGKVEIIAVCDAIEEKAKLSADAFDVPVHYRDVERMLREAEFDLLVNTTPIPEHFSVSLAALRSGRHVYTQKPMSLDVGDATVLIDEAHARGLKLASAPEHPVRPIIRKIASLVADGAIGRVAFARVPSSHEGPEKHNVPRDSSWFYQPGSSPILDLGVHGLSQITAILGPVERLACFSGRTSSERIHTANIFKGKRFPVAIDDNSLLMLDFGDATFAFLDATYCVEASLGPKLEIYGSEGTLSVMGDGGNKATLHLYESSKAAWRDIDLGTPPAIRDLGVQNMVEALRGEAELVLTGERGRHLVEIMDGAIAAAASGKKVTIESRF